MTPGYNPMSPQTLTWACSEVLSWPLDWVLGGFLNTELALCSPASCKANRYTNPTVCHRMPAKAKRLSVAERGQRETFAYVDVNVYMYEYDFSFFFFFLKKDNSKAYLCVL